MNNLPFSTKISQHIKFGTVKDMTDRTKEIILIYIGNVVGLYNKRGFKIETILVEP